MEVRQQAYFWSITSFHPRRLTLSALTLTSPFMCCRALDADGKKAEPTICPCQGTPRTTACIIAGDRLFPPALYRGAWRHLKDALQIRPCLNLVLHLMLGNAIWIPIKKAHLKVCRVQLPPPETCRKWLFLHQCSQAVPCAKEKMCNSKNLKQLTELTCPLSFWKRN